VRSREDFFNVFDIQAKSDFDSLALEIYDYQLQFNPVYNQYCRLIKKEKATRVEDIPFLPIEFYKSHQVITQPEHDVIFTSSGTTGKQTSKHHVYNLDVYEKSLDVSFEQFYGKENDYCILALLPHYLEREGSSLVYMVNRWMNKCSHPLKGFYLHDLEKLNKTLATLSETDQPVILIGVTFALLQLAEINIHEMANLTIIETGGMKGMRKELTRKELHASLRESFPSAEIHSEYGMTELLSQAYAMNGNCFQPPKWMRASTRDTKDPLSSQTDGKTGGLNIIDLANFDSCSFIATQDLGKTYSDGSFEVLGRFDHSDVRGCNLMSI
jgi:phenylacetate-coenzyme A ligase PaaK-like adenylate-forming protein